jgi:hypothetical protein
MSDDVNSVKSMAETHLNESNVRPKTIAERGKATQFKAGDERVRQLAIKAGKTVTPKRLWAAQLAGMRKRGVVDVKWFEQRLLDPACNVFHLQQQLDKVLEKWPDKPTTQIMAIQQMINLHKAHFGEKVKSENVNFNINMNQEEWEKRFNDIPDQQAEIIDITKEDQNDDAPVDTTNP